jgi:RNA polymerase sigma-32 factor
MKSKSKKKSINRGKEKSLAVWREQTSLPTTYDGLRAYLTEISKYPVLSREEEEAEVKKMLNGDLEAAKKLVTYNLRLVVKIAFEYRNTWQNVMDLIQEGNIGLMKAISMYDPSKGTKLSYYASWWIRSYILKFLIDNFRLVKIGTTQAQKKLFYNLIQEQKKLEAQGLPALPEVISQTLHVKEEEVNEMTARLSGAAEFSIDQPTDPNGEAGEATFMSTYKDNSKRPDYLVEEKETEEQLKKRLDEFALTLNEKERTILKDRLLSEVPKTLQEIGEQFGITKERTRQLEQRLLDKLKVNLSDLYPG